MEGLVWLLVYQWIGLQIVGFYWLGLTGRLDAWLDEIMGGEKNG